MLRKQNNISCEIICPSCAKKIFINDAFTYFDSNVQKCSYCNAEINTGSSGIEEQIILYLKSGKSYIQAIKFCRDVKKIPLKSAKIFVENLARQNNIKINYSLNRKIKYTLLLFFLLLISFMLVLLGGVLYDLLME